MDCGEANLFGKPEVQNFGATALGDENVGGLDVAMNDSFTVCGVERVRNPNRQTHQDIRLDRVSGDAMLERRAFQKFHGDKRFAVLIVNFVDRADVRMIQGRSRLGFALKAAEGLRVFGYVVRQELECHKAAEFQILSFVDHTHSAAAELFDDAVVRDGTADERGRVRHGARSY